MLRYLKECLIATFVVAVTFAVVILSGFGDPEFSPRNTVLLICVAAFLSVVCGPLIAGYLAWSRSSEKNPR